MLEKCVLAILKLNWNQRLGHKWTKLNICHPMLTSSTHLKNWSFHVVERTRTSSRCQKMKNARAKRARILFFIVKYANLWGFCCRRRRGCLSSLIESLRSTTRRQRQRHKFCIFNEAKQKVCTTLTCLFHFCTFLSRSRQICDVKWPFLKFYREGEHTATNLNFLPCLLHLTS